ncbi:MAG: 6-phosphofructokinase [Candidatus Promineifilaceae bacterium]
MKRIALLTSGGDAQGMNAAVRAVVRTALDAGLETYAVREGYQGLIAGGDKIRPIGWNDVGGIIHQGGTIIGSARSDAFLTRSGRRQAALNLIRQDIDALIVIGGDGSLAGAAVFRREWPELVAELVAAGEVAPEAAERHPYLRAAGLIGSIDNDFQGTDITIGADTALHRIVEAIDAITSTAASHQRSFVVEVMGRDCGYLALMGALAGGADWVFIPESPPNLDEWEEKMCAVLRQGRETGRRDSIVVIAEGATDRHGRPITSDYVKQVLEERLGEDVRITILGHVQRGGSPSAFDRNLSTLLGAAAVEAVLAAEADGEVPVLGLVGNKITRTPLATCMSRTEAVRQAMAAHDFERALALRGSSFAANFRTLRTLVRARPHRPQPDQRRLRLAVLNAGAPAPGMNTAVRAAVRLGLDKGHILFGVRNGYRGLVEGDFEEFGWMSVNGWAHRGGAELGTNRKIPAGSDFYAIARNLEKYAIDGLLMIGGWSGHEGALEIFQRRNAFPAFQLPMVCLPATIDNDLPGSELSIGADTALNSIVTAVDKIKQSAVASKRVFVVEVMGQYCGYLALMSALATGAERVYLPEEGVTLVELQSDLRQLMHGFRQGKRLGLIIRNERANPTYTTGFIVALFEEEGGELFDTRQAILGHIQQGGNPSPFDRILATRMAGLAIDYLEEQIGSPRPVSACLGLVGSAMQFTPLEEIGRRMDRELRRPLEQWWLNLRPIARVLAQPGPAAAA